MSSMTRCLAGCLPLVVLSGCLFEREEEPEELATLTVELTPTDEGVVATFDAEVPPGAQDVEIWFGDGEIVRDALSPSHTYVANANYQASLYYGDAFDGGRVTIDVIVDQIPMPMEALALPDDPGTYLLATNRWTFIHNYQSNQPAHTQLQASEAIAFTLDAEGLSMPVDQASVTFFPAIDGEGRDVPLVAESLRSIASFGEEPHVRVPAWTLDGEVITEGGFSMPQLDRTDAPEPNVPHFLQNADFPMDEELELRLRLRSTGAVHGMSYLLVGRSGSKRFDAPEPRGFAVVRVSPAELAEIGPGVVGLYTTLYSEVLQGDVVMRNSTIGYVPIRLVPPDE